MVNRRKLAKENSWYPPNSKVHVDVLLDYCSDGHRAALAILTDIEYHVVTPDGEGRIIELEFNEDDPVGRSSVLVELETGEQRLFGLDSIETVERIGVNPY